MYLLVGAGSGAVVARLGDIYSRRRMALIVLVITVFASLLSAAMSHFALILIGRSLHGLAAAMLPLCFGIARESLPPERRSFAVGIIMAGSSVGIALGLVAGGLIVDRFGWHAIFIASAILALVAWILVSLFVPRSPQNRQTRLPLDIGSMFIFVPAVAALLAISNSGAWGWTSAQVIGLVVFAAVLTALWIRHSLRHPSLLIDVRLFANRSVGLTNISYALLALGGLQVSMVFSVLRQAPTWTDVGFGVTAATAGLIQMPGSISGLSIGPFAGLAMQRVGSRPMMIFGGGLATLGWVLAGFFHGSTAGVLVLVLIINTGTFLIYSSGPNVVMANVPQERTSEATGMLAVIRSIAMGIGAQVAAVLMATSTVTDGGKASYPDATAFFITFLVIAVLRLLATIAAWMLPSRSARPPVTVVAT